MSVNNSFKEEKSKYKRWLTFEHDLQYLMLGLEDDIDKEDWLLLCIVYHSIMVFAMKDKYNETRTTVLDNMEDEFYAAIQGLEERHPDMKTNNIKSFMEDFYFNKEVSL